MWVYVTNGLSPAQPDALCDVMDYCWTILTIVRFCCFWPSPEEGGGSLVARWLAILTLFQAVARLRSSGAEFPRSANVRRELRAILKLVPGIVEYLDMVESEFRRLPSVDRLISEGRVSQLLKIYPLEFGIRHFSRNGKCWYNLFLIRIKTCSP